MKRQPRIVIAGTNSGVGKTTVTLGLMAALKRRGLQVQGFKVGPDYIDRSYHTAITGRPSRNLDTWMTTPEQMREIFLHGSVGADLSIIEGVMGFYDGKDPRSNQGSTAEVSLLLQAPTLLIVNIWSLARSAAAIVKGFASLTEGVSIAGVIANQSGGDGHTALVKTAVEQECGIPVLGGLPYQAGKEIPERHLGLIPAVERGGLQPLFDHLADEIEAQLDVDAILRLADTAPPLPEPARDLFGQQKQQTVKIAVARDVAFSFYYQENFDLLRQAGAELLFFSPLAGEICPPQADGLYLGGGFPEEFARELSAQQAVRADLKKRIAGGLPTLAECGGFMYLCESIMDRDGQRNEMVGVIPCAVQMQNWLVGFGYREVTAGTDHLLLSPGDVVRGHEFHYSTTTELAHFPHAYVRTDAHVRQEEGYAQGSLVAGYTHLYFPSQPAMPRRFVEASRRYRDARKGE